MNIAHPAIPCQSTGFDFAALEAAIAARAAQRKGREVYFRCPLPDHADEHPSARYDPEKRTWYCDICQQGGGYINLGRLLGVIPPSGSRKKQQGRIVATYDYCDEHGELLYQGCRFEPKDFKQRRPDGRGDWEWNLNGVRRVLYHLPELIAADGAALVFVVEGEKDADRLQALGLIATTNAGGAGKWYDEYTETLRGRHVVILPDNDDAGRKHAAQVAGSLHSDAASVKVVELPSLPPKGDVSDWLDAGGTADELRRLATEAPVWTPTNVESLTAPIFPIEVLPPAARLYAEAAAESIPVPVELVAVPLLGAVGALLGSRLHLILKSSYREYPTLYLAMIAPPGAAKSPALKLAMWPLDVLQRGAMKTFYDALAVYDAEIERWKGRKAEDRGPKPTRPVLRHYLSTNLTLEALVSMLAASPGVAIVRDEILSWLRSMDQYRGGKGSDRQEFLSLWASATIKVDRKGGDPIYRPFPVACVVGGIQPDFVGELHDEAQRRDGFVERILPVVLDDLAVGRWNESTIASERFADILAVFEQLDTLPLAGDGSEATEPIGIGVHLHPDARALWRQWFDENAALIEQTPGLANGFYRKLPAHVARLALILHALWNPDNPRLMVSADRMSDAIALGEFFRAHIGRLLPLLGVTSPERSAGLSTRILRILRISERDESDRWVSRSTILNGLRIKTSELAPALESMRDAGILQCQIAETKTKHIELWRRATADTSFGHSDYSDYLPVLVLEPATHGFDGEKSEYSESSNGHESSPELLATARELLKLSPEEWVAYQAELADAPSDDPILAHDVAAVQLAESMIAKNGEVSQ